MAIGCFNQLEGLFELAKPALEALTPRSLKRQLYGPKVVDSTVVPATVCRAKGVGQLKAAVASQSLAMQQSSIPSIRSSTGQVISPWPYQSLSGQAGVQPVASRQVSGMMQGGTPVFTPLGTPLPAPLTTPLTTRVQPTLVQALGTTQTGAAVPSVTYVQAPSVTAPAAPQVRTAADGALPPSDAMRRLREGNARFVRGTPLATRTNLGMRTRLVEEGQAPFAAILGCADSRAPLEKVFDALPGDIFVLRNAGNTCTHAEGSMVGSLEFATGKLGSRLILVLGHTSCGAINGATQAYLSKKDGDTSVSSALEGLLRDLMEVAERAASEDGSTDFDTVSKRAVKTNVFHTMKFLLKYSKTIRDLVSSGQVDLQGGIYNLETGQVDFLGQHPDQEFLFGSKLELPPSMFKQDKPTFVRTTESSAVSPFEALKILEEGNKRFVLGAPKTSATQDMRRALVDKGQAPHAAIVGCSDSRAPIETVFDAMPGDLFVLRNAGNTCTHAEGSIVGSLEFCVGKLGSRLILVMGHTACGAINGATATYLADKTAATRAEPTCALEGLLFGLTKVAQDAYQELGQTASEAELAAHAVQVNVFHSINFLLKFSQPIRDLVAKGELEVQGAIYNLETGRVNFLGQSPKQAELLASKMHVPPGVAGASDSSVLFGLHGVRTPEDPPLPGPEALKLLKEGNLRFAKGAPEAGKVDAQMRKALADVGQAPHTAVLGCADSRVPLELVFDSLPGDLFVLRNAGNTCVHSEGSVLGSLEFCIGALNTKLILILGHTNCGAVKGATSQYLKNKGSAPTEPTNALGALLMGLSDVAGQAEKELSANGSKPSEKEISDAAVKVNVFKSMDYLVDNSKVVGKKVISGEVTLEGGVYGVIVKTSIFCISRPVPIWTLDEYSGWDRAHTSRGCGAFRSPSGGLAASSCSDWNFMELQNWRQRLYLDCLEEFEEFRGQTLEPSRTRW
eukprot:s2325_g4.t1